MHEVIAAVCANDPYSYYASLACSPCLVWRDGMWIAAHPEVVREVMTHASCRVRPADEAVPAAIVGGSAAEVFGVLVRMNDGEVRHVAPRLVLQRALAGVPGDVVRAAAVRVARDVWSDVRPDGVHAHADAGGAVTRWVNEAPVRTVASLLGFEDAHLPQVAALVGKFVACLSPLSSAQQIGAAHAAAQELLAAFEALCKRSDAGAAMNAAAVAGVAHAVKGGSLLVEVLREAEAAGWRGERAILANLLGLLSQTYEATAGLIGNTLVALQRGAQWQGGGGQRYEAALNLVREVALHNPSVQNTRRFVAEDAYIGGVEVKRGQVILVVLAAGGTPFGHGAHKCPGQTMAEIIAASAVEAMLAEPASTSFARLLQPGRLTWRYRASHNAHIPEFMEAK